MGPGTENPLWQGMLLVQVDPGAVNPTVPRLRTGLLEADPGAENLTVFESRNWKPKVYGIVLILDCVTGCISSGCFKLDNGIRTVSGQNVYTSE